MLKQSLVFLFHFFRCRTRAGARSRVATHGRSHRIARTKPDASLDVSVITRADIDASHAPDLLEVLRMQPGVDVVRTGGAGAQTNVFLRGGNSNHVLVLVDGVRVASANTGAFAWENLPLDSVERIEIAPARELPGFDDRRRDPDSRAN